MGIWWPAMWTIPKIEETIGQRSILIPQCNLHASTILRKRTVAGPAKPCVFEGIFSKFEISRKTWKGMTWIILNHEFSRFWAEFGAIFSSNNPRWNWWCWRWIWIARCLEFHTSRRQVNWKILKVGSPKNARLDTAATWIFQWWTYGIFWNLWPGCC